MKKFNRLILIASVVLISLGLISLTLDFFLGWRANLGWPLALIMLGAAFFVLVEVFREKWSLAGLLYLPGSLLAALGLIFLLNILTDDWNAWAYAWMLAVASLGVGVVLANREGHWPRAVSIVAVALIIGGVTLAVLFGAIAGGRFIQVMAPILLVLGGVSLRWLHLETLLPQGSLHRFDLVDPLPAAGAYSAPDQTRLVEPLSARELEVLNLIEQGLSNQEIAARLTLAPSTVKTHINNIYGKLGVQTRIQAIKQAQELNLLRQ
jgi:DNA-binding CsgD family transcriptional regulator